jgi:hypothetical protein
LSSVQGLEWLYIFHGNGYLRQAALDKISVAPRSAFYFAAIAHRLNDWAEPVRASAERCAERVFPLVEASVVAEAAFFLLDRSRYWGRWIKSPPALDAAMARPDVVAQLASTIVRSSSGPTSLVLAQALHTNGIDPYLATIARTAAQPQVRATAYRSLIERCATWQDGYYQQWVDKSLGKYRRAPKLESRLIITEENRERLINLAGADKSAAARKVAADSLIKYRHEFAFPMQLVAALADDKNPGVRERISFLKRVLASESR